MDRLGLQHQFLPPEIRPLRPDMVLIGRAMPVLAVDAFEEKVTGTKDRFMEKPFGLMLGALDDLKANEIYVNTSSSGRSALWGELMSIRARKLGAADFRVAVEIGSARVRPGDFLFGDIDGICVIPIEAANDVFTKALEKARGEEIAKKGIGGGQQRVGCFFEKYGIM
jgi:regulator of RNase E activity RraA